KFRPEPAMSGAVERDSRKWIRFRRPSRSKPMILSLKEALGDGPRMDAETRAAERWLAPFPKTRPPLPPEFQAIYVEPYNTNRSGESTAASLAQRLERWLHRQVAKDVAQGGARSTLELGAGTLNQLPFEPEGAPYDVVEPFADLYRDSPLKRRL